MDISHGGERFEIVRTSDGETYLYNKEGFINEKENGVITDGIKKTRD